LTEEIHRLPYPEEREGTPPSGRGDRRYHTEEGKPRGLSSGGKLVLFRDQLKKKRRRSNLYVQGKRKKRPFSPRGKRENSIHRAFQVGKKGERIVRGILSSRRGRKKRCHHLSWRPNVVSGTPFWLGKEVHSYGKRRVRTKVTPDVLFPREREGSLLITHRRQKRNPRSRPGGFGTKRFPSLPLLRRQRDY